MQNENIKFNFIPRSDDGKIMEGEYVKVTEVGKEYIVSDWGNTVILKYQTPEIELGGIPNPAKNGGMFYRMDYSLAVTEGGNYYRKNINNNVQKNNWHTSGGTIRFRTNAEYINVIVAQQKFGSPSKRSSGRGAAGIDVYTGTGTDRVYCGKRTQAMANPPSTVENITLPAGYKEVLIDLPMFSGVKNVNIAFPKDAEIAAPLSRDFDKPIVFYGSSMTQGAYASRPGTSYANMVSRMLNADCRNLGFTDGAHGEDAMIEYIAKEEMCAFVIDFDHNTALARLEASHYKLYEAVRAAHPDIPIVILSKPIFTVGLDNVSPFYEDEKRIELIKETYNKALASGDKNVYFINGYEDYFPQRALADVFTNDFANANDTGMYFMATAIYNKLAPALEAVKEK